MLRTELLKDLMALAHQVEHLPDHNGTGLHNFDK